MSELIKCKVCGNEMAKSAKACPSCGAKNRKPFYKKWWLWAILLVVVIAAASSGSKNNSGIENDANKTPVIEKNSPKISKAEFEAIQTGMTYEEVVSIIGGEGQLSSQVNVAGYNTKMYMWEGEGSIGANANATFQNNSLASKAQFGLK